MGYEWRVGKAGTSLQPSELIAKISFSPVQVGSGSSDMTFGFDFQLLLWVMETCSQRGLFIEVVRS